jgi:hypothetical protein
VGGAQPLQKLEVKNTPMLLSKMQKRHQKKGFKQSKFLFFYKDL